MVTKLRSLIDSFSDEILVKFIPDSISKNYRNLDDSGREALRASLLCNYVPSAFPGLQLNKEEQSSAGVDLSNDLARRLKTARRNIIPWLNDCLSLDGANILEIGCGTGSSTVALSEQGARVVAVDIDKHSLAVARDMCRIYGLDVEFVKCCATEVDHCFGFGSFDLVVMYACLEHMTSSERIAAMKKTWEMLKPGSLWCIVDTPNRLWYFDYHTSLLPFFDWLPDDIAVQYSVSSPRKFLNEIAKRAGDPNLALYRWGRGVSYHEFEIAIRPARQLTVVSCLSEHKSLPNMLSNLWKLIYGETKLDRSYRSFLKRMYGDIPSAFLKRDLNLILRKSG